MTGFANGERFENEEQVRAYFTVQNLSELFNDPAYGESFTQDELDEMAEKVIKNRWWMA